MGREVTWQFVRDNWQKMRERFTGSFMLQRMVSSVCSEFANEERAKEVEVCVGAYSLFSTYVICVT